VKPVLQSLVLADHVYVDALTGKKVIAGTFSALRSPQFPRAFGRVTHAYISLTEVEAGRVPLELRYVDLSNDQILLRCDLEVPSPGPLETVDFVAEIPPFPMPHPGTYAFELLWNSDIVGSLRITVTQQEQEADETEEEN